MNKKNILVLFPKDWDQLELARPVFGQRYRFHYAGFDLFRFPENARLLSFDAERFIDATVRRARRLSIDAVISNNEQFGALIAACVAERLGLPGNDPAAVIAAQHKYYARQAMARLAPEAVPPFAAFPYTVASAEEIPLAFPFFVKPVKATFSVLARRVDDFGQLRRHLCFRPLERHIIKRLVRPFNELRDRLPGCDMDAHHMIAEGLIEGVQVNVDGYVDAAGVQLIGCVDEHMYPGTMHFSRFEYPSALPAAVQGRIAALAARVLEGIGYRHGFFNMECAWDPASDRLAIVEINPRLASQLAYLYDCVDGINLYEMMLAMALGEPVRRAPQARPWTCAASFAYRRFDGRPVAPPADAALARLAADYPEARLMRYHKRGAGLAREMKWLGSHRYAVLNLCGRDAADLDRRYLAISRLLGYEAQGVALPRRMAERERLSAATGRLQIQP